MKFHAGAGLSKLVARVVVFARAALVALVALSIAAPLGAQAGKDGPVGKGEEDFKDVDPYTKGEAELVQRAGYLRLAPFQVAEGITAQDMVELLGGIEMLWAETEHFKIISTLQTYKPTGDVKENAKLGKEFAALAKRVPTFKTVKPSKVDPWLRLHLYAYRMEQLYADFLQRTGFADADFPALGAERGPMGSGPYLGKAAKPVIFLAEKSSALGRFNLRYFKTDESRSYRYVLPGGAAFVGISAEALRDGGYSLDTAMHCALAAGVVANFLDNLRDSNWSTPLWLDLAMGHWFSRQIDPRYSYYANGTSRYVDDESQTKWEPRVRGLVENEFAYTWRDMLGTLQWDEFSPQHHLLIWSRVDWMLQQKDGNLRAFLEPLTVTLPQGTPAELKAVQLERAVQALKAGFGKTPEECDAAWRAWVLKTYDRK